MDQTSITTFRSLLHYGDGLTPGDAQRRAGQLLPKCVSESQLTWWTPSDPFPTVGVRILIGVAVWSMHDLKLLDAVDTAMRELTRTKPVVHVFDVDTIWQPMWDLCIPGIGAPSQTPVVGLWIDDVLQQYGCGYLGRKIVAEFFGLDMQELVSKPSSTPAV